MSLSDLEKMKLLRPKSEWSGKADKSRVNLILASLTAAIGIAGCVFMIMGNGHFLTWIGLLMFGVSLVGFSWTNLRGVWKA